MEKVLITGADGFVGQQLKKKMSQIFDVTGLDITNKNNDLNILKCDITKKNELEEILKDKEFNYVIHCAAIAHNDDNRFSETDFINVNYVGTKNLVDYFNNRQIDIFIFFSTIAVYGEQSQQLSIDNKTETNPVSIYAKTKVDAESYIIEKSNFPYYILRFTPIYSRFLINDIAKRVLLKTIGKKNIAFIIGKGTQKHSFMHLEEIDKQIIGLLNDKKKKNINKIYNIKSQDFSTKGILKYLQEEAKIQISFVIPVPKFILKMAVNFLALFFKSKKKELKSIYWKLATNNVYLNN